MASTRLRFYATYFLFGGLCLIFSLSGPQSLTFGSVTVLLHPMLRWTAGFLLVEGCLYLFHVKVGKHWHRDRMLSLIAWRGDEQVLDVGCGRGLLLAGAARRLTSGHATGIDLWSNVDMGNNSPEATERNLAIEGVSSCTLGQCCSTGDGFCGWSVRRHRLQPLHP